MWQDSGIKLTPSPYEFSPGEYSQLTQTNRSHRFATQRKTKVCLQAKIQEKVIETN